MKANKEIDAILSATRYITVSTVDQKGKAWAAPVWYVTDDELNFYWWSPMVSQHSVNISHNPNVYITIFDSTVKEGDGIGLYVRAVASELEEQDIPRIIALYNATTKQFKMSEGNCSGVAPTRLYKAVPREVWINRGGENEGYYEDYREAIK